MSAVIASLLTVAPQGQEAVGRMVCGCFPVGLNTISRTIKDQNLVNTDGIGKAFKMGANGGSCVPE
ncbi:MAG: (2Fe-2S)-binding protein [Gammaproteobacteria bacterium]|nr:(2Fe-2S)-binding protein [Gammaproteobacteria bacterium]